MATEDQISSLRMKIGETIPPSGTETDTLFSDTQITAWIDSTNSLDSAAVEGWEAKMAHWANLVNVVDGAASREFSDLVEHAAAMIEYYSDKAMGIARSRSRVGKIIRS